MNRQDAERITDEYIKTVFGFALSRCRCIEDAQDLSQDIMKKVFLSLIKREDIRDVSKFIWSVAHNCLCNYYRDNSYAFVGVSVDDIADSVCDDTSDTVSLLTEQEEISRLQSEIAYLSKLQRQIIIAYYYENKKQNKIAEELNIPVGTVKWHLFEAKKELKRGMETMRESSELKFNPVKFDMCSYSGIIGEKGEISNFFRSAISQNIIYTVRKKAKTVNEIADALGISPVYVESEAEYLEEYGFMLKHKDKYLCNILIDEPNDEINRLHDEMYMKAAKLFANELYDSVIESGLLGGEGILGGYDSNINTEGIFERDTNFILWSLIPFITAFSGEATVDKGISFNDICTIRPDGGKNICYASVYSSDVKPPLYNDEMKNFRGPFWNGLTDKITLWTIDSEWSSKRLSENYQLTVVRDLTLLNNYLSDVELSEEDIAYLAEKGYIAVYGNPGGLLKTALRVIYIKDEETRKSLLFLGDSIKEKYSIKFNEFKAEYISAVLKNTPTHLQKMRMFGLNNIFFCDAWFILHCLKELIINGRLRLPDESQKQALTTVLYNQ